MPPLPAVPAESGDEEEEDDEEEEWSESYQPLAVEQAHLGSAAPLGAPPGPDRVCPRQPSYEQVSAARPPGTFLGQTSSELGAGFAQNSASQPAASKSS